MLHPINHMDLGNCERYDWSLPRKYQIVWESGENDGTGRARNNLVVKKRFGKYYACEFVPVTHGIFSNNDVACYLIDNQECRTIEAAKERLDAWQGKRSRDRRAMVARTLRTTFEARGDSIQEFSELLKKDPNWTNVVNTYTSNSISSNPVIRAQRLYSEISLEITHIGSGLCFELTLPPLNSSALFQATHQEVLDIGNAAISNKKVRVIDRTTVPFVPILSISIERDECTDDKFMSTIDTLMANALNVSVVYQRKGWLPD